MQPAGPVISVSRARVLQCPAGVLVVEVQHVMCHLNRPLKRNSIVVPAIFILESPPMPLLRARILLWLNSSTPRAMQWHVMVKIAAQCVVVNTLRCYRYSSRWCCCAIRVSVDASCALLDCALGISPVTSYSGVIQISLGSRCLTTALGL